MTAWSQMELQYGKYVPAGAASGAARWSVQLAAATTRLRHRYAGDQRLAVTSRRARGAMLDEVTVARCGYGGVPVLLANANHAVSVARGDNLVTGPVPSLITALSRVALTPAATTQAIAHWSSVPSTR